MSLVIYPLAIPEQSSLLEKERGERVRRWVEEVERDREKGGEGERAKGEEREIEKEKERETF